MRRGDGRGRTPEDRGSAGEALTVSGGAEAVAGIEAAGERALAGPAGRAPDAGEQSVGMHEQGGGSYVRGAEYARQQAVTHATWDPEDNALRGAVQGQGGRIYDVAAYFSLPAGRPARFSTGECSCPVGYNCKHVVALVLSALAS